MKIPLVIMTSPKTEWALPGLLILLDKYSSLPGTPDQWLDIYLMGYDETVYDKCPIWSTHNRISLGRFSDYPAHRWSDASISALSILREKEIESAWMLLDDYWPIRQIDRQGIEDLHLFHKDNADHILKIDLTYDRLRSGSVTDYEPQPYVGHMDMIQASSESQYHMSLWGGLFSTKLLLDVVKPGWTAQEVELNGTPVLRELGYKVLGTRQAPLLHQNVCHAGGCFNFPGPKLRDVDMNYLRECGLTNGY